MNQQKPKTVAVSATALKAAGERSTTASAKLENRSVPVPMSPNSTATDAALPPDERETLLGDVTDVLPRPIARADVYRVEHATQLRAFCELMSAAVDGSLPLNDILNDHFVRDLHSRMFGRVWNWAGRFRRLELNIGCPPENIAVELRNALGTIAYRWTHTNDWTPRQLGIAVHAETVRIHPFVDGNGRTTRLLADLAFAAVQNPTELLFDWDLDKTRYIELLRAYDTHRDPADLAEFIGTEQL